MHISDMCAVCTSSAIHIHVCGGTQVHTKNTEHVRTSAMQTRLIAQNTAALMQVRAVLCQSTCVPQNAVLATLEVMALTIGGGIASGVIAGLAIYMLVKVFSELVSLD